MEALADRVKTIKRVMNKHGFNLQLGSELKPIERVRFGVLTLDYLFGAPVGADGKLNVGLRYGAFHYVTGPQSAGKSSAMLKVASNIQKTGEPVLIVDGGRTLDDPRYNSAMGLDPEYTFFVREETEEKNLEAIRKAIDAGVRVLLIDDWAALCPAGELRKTSNKGQGKERDLSDQQVGLQARVASKFFRMTTHLVSQKNAIVLITQQLRTTGIGTVMVRDEETGGNAQKFYAATSWFLRRGKSGECPRQGSTLSGTPVGFAQVITVKKTKGGKTQPIGTNMNLQWVEEKGWEPGREAFLFLHGRKLLDASGRGGWTLNRDSGPFKEGTAWKSRRDAESALGEATDDLLRYFLSGTAGPVPESDEGEPIDSQDEGSADPSTESEEE